MAGLQGSQEPIIVSNLPKKFRVDSKGVKVWVKITVSTQLAYDLTSVFSRQGKQLLRTFARVLLKVPCNQLDTQRVGEVTPENKKKGMGVQQGGVGAKVRWSMHQYKMGIPGRFLPYRDAISSVSKVPRGRGLDECLRSRQLLASSSLMGQHAGLV